MEDEWYTVHSLFFPSIPARELHRRRNGEEELGEGEEDQERRVEAHAGGVCQSHPLVRAARRANRARQKRRLAHVEAQGSGARDSTTPVHGGGAARRGMQRRFCSEEGWNSGSRTECFSGPGSVGLQSGRRWGRQPAAAHRRRATRARPIRRAGCRAVCSHSALQSAAAAPSALSDSRSVASRPRECSQQRLSYIACPGALARAQGGASAVL